MIVVDLTKVYKNIVFSGSEVNLIVKFICKKEKIKNAELSFVIVNDTMIRKINKKFLYHDYITDVITFPLEIKGVNAEIYINAQQAKRQSEENNVSLRNEITRLIVHGILHSIGYDDTTVTNQKKMNLIQERYVAKLSLKK